MSRATTLVALVAWSGLALVFAEIRWFRRPSLTRRLAPHLANTRVARRPWTLADVAATIGPALVDAGDALASLAGIDDPLRERLDRAHDPRQPTEIRLRQATLGIVGLLGGTLIALVTSAPTPVAAVFVAAPAVGVVLAVEHGVTRAAVDWQERLLAELPVVAEQIGMSLGAGWSLAGALERVAARGSGACARDLRRVVARLGHGLDERRALREWAERARLDAVDRLVGVLSLERETADLGALVAAEARQARQEAHRRLVESIERRNQQVWIPVTVAALVPGVLLMAVPFVDALTLFSG